MILFKQKCVRKNFLLQYMYCMYTHHSLYACTSAIHVIIQSPNLVATVQYIKSHRYGSRGSVNFYIKYKFLNGEKLDFSAFDRGMVIGAR